jgi:hypothetical protein
LVILAIDLTWFEFLLDVTFPLSDINQLSAVISFAEACNGLQSTESTKDKDNSKRNI